MIEIKLDRLIDDMRLLRSQMIAYDRQLKGIEASLNSSEPSEQQPGGYCDGKDSFDFLCSRGGNQRSLALSGTVTRRSNANSTAAVSSRIAAT